MLFLVTVSKATSVPLLFNKKAVALALKFVPVIVNVWLPVPSPDVTLVGDIDVIDGALLIILSWRFYC